MKILLNNSITKVIVYKKCEYCYPLSIESNFKRKIGKKWFIFPVYDIIPSAVVKWGWSKKEFVSSVEDFKNDKRYIPMIFIDIKLSIDNPIKFLYRKPNIFILVFIPFTNLSCSICSSGVNFNNSSTSYLSIICFFFYKYTIFI